MGRKPGTRNARITVPMVLRMRDLRAAGLSAEAVARVIELDYGSRPHETTVRRYTGAAGGALRTAGLASGRSER